MGVLGDQPKRDSHHASIDRVYNFLIDASSISEELGVPVATVVAAKHALELERKNNIDSLGGDYWDEQAGGFGAILSRIADALENKKL